MWDVIISIVIFNTLHSVDMASLNYRPVIWMTDLQKSKVVRNGPESRPILFKSPKLMCGPVPFPDFSCEQRQPMCNNNNQDPSCNTARPPPVLDLERAPHPPRENPMQKYEQPAHQQQYQHQAADLALPPSQYMLREHGAWLPYNRHVQQRYVSGRTTSYRSLYYQSYPDRKIKYNRDPHLVNYVYNKPRQKLNSDVTTSTLAPDQTKVDSIEKDKPSSPKKNRWGTTSTQAPFPGGITPSLETPAENKCGQFAVCYKPIWTERTEEKKATLKLHYHEEMDPDLMKYILPRH